MYTYIIPLYQQHQAQAYRFLEFEDPWHIIALDALLTYKLNHPWQRWFGEIKEDKLVGVIFQDRYLLYFAYQKAPAQHSPLYPFLRNNFPVFTTHERKEVLHPLISRLANKPVTPVQESLFVTQSEATRNIASKPVHMPTGLIIRRAYPVENNKIIRLYRGSSVEEEIDPELIRELILLGRVYVAEVNGQLVGTIMRLKETSRYSLVGGLYVIPEMRRQGIARLLGQTILVQVLQSGRKICFYYQRNKELKQFYRQGKFISLGIWSTYSISLVER